MRSNLTKKSVESVTTTVGELVEIITKIALQVGASEKEGYELASLTLESILKKNAMKAKNLELFH